MLYIKAIEPNVTNYSIKITYDDNVTIIAHFEHLLEKGVMPALKNPDVFNQVKIGHHGRSIEWVDLGIDFCADGLRMKFIDSQAVA